MSDRPLPAIDNDRLHAAAGLKQHEALPKPLLEEFWELKHLANRMSGQVSDGEIRLLVLKHCGGKKTEQEKAPPTIVQMWRKKEVKAGDTITAIWRKRPHDVKILGINAATKGVRCQFDDGEEREIKPEDVRLPELVEA